MGCLSKRLTLVLILVMAISVANLLMVKAANAQTATPTPTPPTITQTTVVNDSLELSMSVDKTVFEVGEPVDITLVVTNISNQTVDYETSPVWQMMLRFIISNGTNSSIYQFFPNQPMPMIMGPETLQPRGNITDNFVWYQNYSGPSPEPVVSSGTYYIVGRGDTSLIDENDTPCTLRTDPLEILIVGNTSTPSPTAIPAATPTPTPSPKPSPTPTVTPSIPELSWLIITPLLLSVLSVALIVRYRKKACLKQ